MAVHTLLKKNILIDMINEDYCYFEVAKLLKEKGFDWECETSYYISNEGCENAVSVGDFTKVRPWREALIAAPTHQMAMKWLREVHNIAIDTEWEHLWYVYVKPMTANPFEDDYCQCFSAKYEEAVEAALKYSLENLI